MSEAMQISNNQMQIITVTENIERVNSQIQGTKADIKSLETEIENTNENNPARIQRLEAKLEHLHGCERLLLDRLLQQELELIFYRRASPKPASQLSPLPEGVNFANFYEQFSYFL